MKKPYQKPKVIVLAIATEGVMQTASGVYTTESIPQLGGDTPADNSVNLGKRHVIDWDEEEE